MNDSVRKRQPFRTAATLAALLGAPSLLIWLVGGSPGSALEPQTQALTSPHTYTGQVEPVLRQKCFPCHSSASKMGGLVMESYEGLIKGGGHGPVIVPGKSGESRVVLMLEGKVQPRMPFGLDPLPAADIAAIKAWIDAGAQGPAPGERVPSAGAPQASAADAQAQAPVIPPSPTAAAPTTQTSAATAKERPVDFDREIRPILSDNCFACHGPDEQARQAKMRLDTKEGMFADRGGYQVIVGGKSAASRLYVRVSSKDPGFRMPPVYSNRSLTPQQVELICQWIDQGAQWRVH